MTGTDLLTARDAALYLGDAPAELRSRLRRLARDPTNVTKRDRVLTQIDAMDQWLTVARRAVTAGRLGDWEE